MTMLLQDLLATSARGITVNKTRSSLTMLGIVIGVASVVLMVSIGNTFQTYILTQVQSIGSQTVDIMPTGLQNRGESLDSLTYEDFEAVKRLSTVSSVVPVIIVPQPVHYGTEERSPLVFGTRKEFFVNYNLKLDRGRFLDDADEQGAASVAVIAAETATDLFGNADPIGKRIAVGGYSLTVVGTLAPVGSALLQELDTPVYLPFSVARSITGQQHLSYMTLKSVGDQALAREDISLLLRSRHRLNNPEGDPDKDDFIVRGAEQITSIINSVTLGLTIFLSLVAGISLLVGGIGIMNIMLVSVTERTREIGLRKAVGARRRDILLQFLIESVSLTVTGGAVGILIGSGLGWMLARVAARFLGELSYVISPMSVVLALAMAVGTGLVFGIYPARRASLLSPMEALRYE